MEVDVLIPVYRPDGKLTELLKRLKMQNYPIHRVILMNTEEKHFPAELTGIWDRVEVYHLAKEEFDHGGTRDRGVRMSTADLVVCMTQDAMPADETLIEELVKPFDDPEVWAAYARQLPNEDCREVEKYTRSFNYPEQSMVRTMIKQGGKIAYCAKAKVIHSHNYSAFQQFHRNFDLAVSQTMYPEVFGGIRSESEGIKLVKKSLSYCIKIGKPWLMIQVVTQSAGKFLGYKMGQQYKSLPMWLILRCTMSPSFWRGGKA